MSKHAENVLYKNKNLEELHLVLLYPLRSSLVLSESISQTKPQRSKK
jgi:hypothetical protein